MNKHVGIRIDDRDTDYFAGANSPIEFKAVNPSNDWTPYLPDFDLQKINGYESEACVPFAATQSVETQINYFLKNNLLPASTVQWLQTNGYLEPAGTIHLSERFIAKVDGTDPATGTPLQNPWDAFRKFGCLPYKDWPFDSTINSDSEFYAPIPQNLLDKAKQFLNYFAFQYHKVAWGGTGTPISVMKQALQQAPLCIGTAVCEPWDQVNVPTCPSVQPEHSTMVYSMDTVTHILDHYVPFEKDFQFTYNIPYVMQGIVQIVQPPPTPPAPPITVPAVQTWLSALKAWLLNLQAQLKGARFAGEPPRSSKWPEVRKAHLEIEPTCQVCGCNKKLNVHHIMPFHFDESKELDPDNLITLCQDPKHECHIRFGHFGNYATKYNPNIKVEAPLWLQRFTSKTEAEAIKQ